MSTDEKISVKDVEEMMSECDIDGNGLIDFEEWQNFFTAPAKS
jgi:Ca2+-binding EF-hand superfamily protein